MDDVVTQLGAVWDAQWSPAGRQPGWPRANPVDAFRSALRDEDARRAYDFVRGASGWLVYTFASAETLVMSARPRSDPVGALDLVDAPLTPRQFSGLARYAAGDDKSILAALRDYLSLVRDARRDLAGALVGVDH